MLSEHSFLLFVCDLLVSVSVTDFATFFLGKRSLLNVRLGKTKENKPRKETNRTKPQNEPTRKKNKPAKWPSVQNINVLIDEFHPLKTEISLIFLICLSLVIECW